jgi:hypothetical protein
MDVSLDACPVSSDAKMVCVFRQVIYVTAKTTVGMHLMRPHLCAQLLQVHHQHLDVLLINLSAMLEVDVFR